MSEDILKIESLRVHFDTLDGPVEALHSVDLSVSKGQIMGLVGESGCGKSVTSLVTIGLATCDIDEGSVKYQGKELIHNPSPEKQIVVKAASRVTELATLAIIIGVVITLFSPETGVLFCNIFILIGIVSWLISYFMDKETRDHTKFMRWVRGNEISMIFQEPMTALNPLYTVEKQVSEVMSEHDRLVDAETSTMKRVGLSIVSPLRFISKALRTKPLQTSLILMIVGAVILSHLLGFADTILDILALPLVFLIQITLPILFILVGIFALALLDGAGLLLLFFAFFLNPDSPRYVKEPTPIFTIPDSVKNYLSYSPLFFASWLVVVIMFWMPLSALLGILVICTLLALPLMIMMDYLDLDPAHRRQVISILEDVRIPNPEAVVNMYPHELSGGMRQRVMIAMMMACEPKLLIADEPTTALDVTIQAQILKLMKDLRDEKGTAILLITHDLGVVAEMCDAVTVMYAGEVVETGSIEDVLSTPRMPYSIGLLHSIPRIEEDSNRRDVLPIIPGQVPDPNEHFDGCRFHPRCPFADSKCVSTPPPMVEIKPGHLAACHYVDKTVNVRQVQDAFDEFALGYEVGGPQSKEPLKLTHTEQNIDPVAALIEQRVIKPGELIEKYLGDDSNG